MAGSAVCIASRRLISAPESLLHATIFFDFRALYGTEHLVEQLRAWLTDHVRGNQRFLHQMAANALRNRPPLGVVRDFVVGKGNKLDLKMNGVTPFVDAARIFSLATGAGKTNTVQRQRASAAALRVPASEVATWSCAGDPGDRRAALRHYRAGGGRRIGRRPVHRGWLDADHRQCTVA